MPKQKSSKSLNVYRRKKPTTVTLQLDVKPQPTSVQDANEIVNVPQVLNATQSRKLNHQKRTKKALKAGPADGKKMMLQSPPAARNDKSTGEEQLMIQKVIT